METELAIGALSLTCIALFLLYQVYLNFRPTEKSEWESHLDSMINGYDIQLPKEVTDYKELISSNTQDKKQLCTALLKRAISIIPLANRVQGETNGMERLSRKDMLRDDAFHSFKHAEKIVQAEMQEVVNEAQRLRPDIDWGRTIYPQASKLSEEMKRKMEGVAMEERKMAEAKAKAHDEEMKEKAKAARKEKERLKALKELMEEDSKKKN